MYPKRLSPVVRTAIRYFHYALLVGAMALCVTWEAYFSLKARPFGEDSLLEFLQITALLATMAMAFLAGRLTPSRSPLSSVLTAISAMAFIRELDFALDRYLFDGGWQVLVFLTAVIAISHGWQHRTALKSALPDFISSPSFGVMASGFFTVFVFSRLIGREVLWQAIMGKGYMRVVKTAVEESMELMGYTLILIGSMEYLCETLRIRMAEKNVSSHPTLTTSPPGK